MIAYLFLAAFTVWMVQYTINFQIAELFRNICFWAIVVRILQISGEMRTIEIINEVEADADMYDEDFDISGLQTTRLQKIKESIFQRIERFI